MNIKEEVIKLIVEYFKNKNIDYTPRHDLQWSLLDFMNLEMKLIKPIPRTVFKSDMLKSRVIPIQYLKALFDIEMKIKRGEDITYHQSKAILDPTNNDDLLNDWIIHHIHLSSSISVKDSPFYERSDYLLFATFRANQAFLIDIREHKEQDVFAKKEFLEIIDNNWPQILTVHTHEDAVFFNNNYSDSDIKILRRKGYYLGTTAINGKIIINPGLGTTTSRHNIHVVKRANEVMRYLFGALEEVEKDEEGMKEALSKEVEFEVKELDLCIHRLDKWPFFALYENNSKCYIQKN